MKAIVLPYVVDQHEPSTPLRELVDVPDSAVKQLALMERLFEEVFGNPYEEADEEYVVPKRLISYGTEKGYGDINYGDGEFFIFLTFVS